MYCVYVCVVHTSCHRWMHTCWYCNHIAHVKLSKYLGKMALPWLPQWSVPLARSKKLLAWNFGLYLCHSFATQSEFESFRESSDVLDVVQYHISCSAHTTQQHRDKTSRPCDIASGAHSNTLPPPNIPLLLPLNTFDTYHWQLAEHWSLNFECVCVCWCICLYICAYVALQRHSPTYMIFLVETRAQPSEIQLPRPQAWYLWLLHPTMRLLAAGH